MPLTALDHYTIRTSDLDRAVRFYAEILGLESGARPPFRFAGAWLYCDGRPVVHLAVRGQKAGGETGALDHLAFRADDRVRSTRVVIHTSPTAAFAAEHPTWRAEDVARAMI